MMNKSKMQIDYLPVIAYAEVMGMTPTPTVRSATAKLKMNIFDT